MKLVAALLLGLLTGCAGYRLGATQELPYRSVAVPVFKNATLQPQLENQVSNAILRRFQSDGTLRVEGVGKADVVVTGEITRFYRRSLRSVRNETGTPREYRISIDARIEVRDRTGKLLFAPTVVTGRAEAFIGTDLQSTDEQALPLIADDLAKRVVTLVAEKW